MLIGIPVNTVHPKAVFGEGFVGEVLVFFAKPQTYMDFSGEYFNQIVEMANQIVVQNPVMDARGPYFLHPNENPGASLVSTRLNGDNYRSWTRTMCMTLDTMKEMEFVDGTITKPPSNNPLYPY
ncbi:PREDICTED: chloroplastic group IIB intron splicing facilitator CRS2-B, chloroplastic-like [Lupinus angustifolius]|uniref:chloroplastic group IIB intron splicing facilitator CRS2-B, chloroplastic-like n=1 Tax=Lupinus angustifolius TaxID=3871 RepID=UPI00092E6CA4|nr:PREDICTED: chloroplastic group IIB intron splicing facilitator CRS2-B, chloroplastic-like [Lupinus angustifolius]